MNRVLITGGTGFIGSAIVERLHADNANWPVAAVRNREKAALLLGSSEIIEADFLSKDISWQSMFNGIDVVIHTAALVHVAIKDQQTISNKFEHVNVESTIKLARHALLAGVRRFIYISTVGIHGVEPGRDPIRESDAAWPQSEYARSKYRAEQALIQQLSGESIELVVIRAPMVYGPGAPGKFEQLIRLIIAGIPLPFGAIRNRRSFIALDNLVDFIVACIDHPAAADQVFLVSDDNDLSTPDLIRLIANALHMPAKLFSVPTPLIKLVLTIIGKRELWHSLCGSYQIDISHARQLIGWRPPLSVEQALEKLVQARQQVHKSVG